jgi:hypothetical protein
MKRQFLVSGTASVGVSFEIEVDVPDDLEDEDTITDFVFDHLTEPGVADLHVIVGGYSGQGLQVKGADLVPRSVHWNVDGCLIEASEVEDVDRGDHG